MVKTTLLRYLNIKKIKNESINKRLFYSSMNNQETIRPTTKQIGISNLGDSVMGCGVMHTGRDVTDVMATLFA